MDDVITILKEVEEEGTKILLTTGVVSSKTINQMILDRLNCDLDPEFKIEV